MPVISFGGLASGLDTNGIINGLLAAERQPIVALQRKQENARSQLSIVQNINSKLQALRTKAQALDTLREFEALRAVSSDDAKVKVTATSEATAGSFAIDNVVRALNQKNRSNSFAARTDTLATGNLVITQGGTPYTISLDASNNTVEGLVGAINAKSGLGVTASLFYDGSSYRILLSSDQTGTGAAFTVDESGLSGGALPGFSAAGNLVQSARNASFTVDGLTVTSPSNTVSGVLPGLTFDLVSEYSNAAVTVTVSPDPDAVAARVREFVTAYNDAAGAILAQFQYAGGGKPASPASLFGDTTLRGIQQRMATLVSEAVAGLPEDRAALSQVGVSLGRDGKLTLDEAKLKSAVLADLRGVARIFASDTESSPATTGAAAKLVAELDSYLDTTSGLLKAKEDGLNGRIADLAARIADMERRLDDYEESLRRQFTALERVMSQLQAQGNFLSQQLLARK